MPLGCICSSATREQRPPILYPYLHWVIKSYHFFLEKSHSFSLCFVSNETTQTYALITSPLALAPAFPQFRLALSTLPTAWPQIHYSSGSQT